MPTETRPRRRWRDGAESSATPNIGRAAQLAAQEIGCQPKTAAHHISEVKFVAAAIVRAYRRTADEAGLEAFLRPIRQAQEGSPREVTDELVLDEQTADSREDEAEVAYLRNPTPATRDTWIRQLRRQAALTSALADALEAERES